MLLKSLAKSVDRSEEEIDRLIDICGNFKTTKAIWSVWEVAEHMSDVAVEGTDLKLAYTTNWGVPVEISLPDNPTWNDLMRAGDDAIMLSGDMHHVFIENFAQNGNIIEMTCGS
jgi:hypothetical protein